MLTALLFNGTEKSVTIGIYLLRQLLPWIDQAVREICTPAPDILEHRPKIGKYLNYAACHVAYQKAGMALTQRKLAKLADKAKAAKLSYAKLS